MSLSGVMRRAASRLAPFSIRASTVTQRQIHQSTTTSALFATKTCSSSCNCSKCVRAFPSFHRSFATSVVKKEESTPLAVKSDESLLRVIESEIECAFDANKADEDDVEERAPEGFPFELEDKPGMQTVTLTREYHGETITVEVHMPDLISGEEDENADDGEGGDPKCSLPIVVRVSKKTGPAMEFGCTAYPDEIIIDSLTVRDPENSEDQIAYEGPEFQDLDENLQKAFHKYLEIRGIKPSTTNYMHGFMIEKDAREYITWLESLKNFVKA